MPPTPEKDFISRLADAGEDAIHRLSDMPGANRLVDTVNGMRTRMDELQKKVRGIDALEQRVAALEKQVAALTKPAQKPAAKPSVRVKRTSGGASGEHGGSSGGETPPVAP